ncbi:MAG: Arginine utilization regulatory protein RocR [Syntrophorhabdus sp. PtaU1.Bin058]|nr:MAG: Arginine utilization regulatory protein RocR [Syntrophorhabdus sp. PtaU1.Bin058]
MKEDDELLYSLQNVLGKYELDPTIIRALLFFFKNPYTGLTIIDRDMHVHFMDKASEKFLGLEYGGAKGMDIRELVPKTGLTSAVETGLPIIGRILEVKDRNRVSVVYPIKQNGEIVGAIGQVIFHSIEEIERINTEIQELKKQIRYYKEKTHSDYKSIYTFNDIIGNNRSIREAIHTAQKLSFLDVDVLIYGESGTGKELFAQSIHNYIHSNQPFVKINCPTIPFDLAESELFGYEKGAFTGASALGKVGSFETAHNGTVFLDEISSLPLSIQAKLLRVLQEREIRRVGSTKTKKIHFKLIAATNVDLKKSVIEGNFRDDLYYRIAKAIIYIPPLRERKEDIPVYLNHFLKVINKSFKTNINDISSKAIEILIRYDWPGNIRELINILEQAVIKAWDSKKIREEHLPQHILSYAGEGVKKDPFDSNRNIEQEISTVSEKKNIKQEIIETEKNLIMSALKQTGGNKRKTAMLLSMPRSTLYKKIKRYKIDPFL